MAHTQFKSSIFNFVHLETRVATLLADTLEQQPNEILVKSGQCSEIATTPLPI